MSAWLKACQLCVLLSVVPALLSSPAQADTEELEVMTSSHHDTLLICVLCRLSTMIRRQWPRLCHRWRTWGSEPSRDPRHTTSVSGKGETFLTMFISIHQKYLLVPGLRTTSELASVSGRVSMRRKDLHTILVWGKDHLITLG